MFRSNATRTIELEHRVVPNAESYGVFSVVVAVDPFCQGFSSGQLTSMAFLTGMVSVPKLPSTPPLSIIVPVGADVSKFDDTLVSVLENRPPRCEVIVPHDGSYDDPFDLGDEVRLVSDAGGNFVDVVMAGARAARGEFVHVLAGGLRATEGWTDAALKSFGRDEVASVSPVIRSAENRCVVSAGWGDTQNGLLQPLDAGRRDSTTDDATSSVGAYLDASFWRRSVFLSLGDGFLYDGGHGRVSVSETTYVFHHLLRQSGWQSVLAAECEVLSGSPQMIGEQATVLRGRRIAAAYRYFHSAGPTVTVTGLLKAAIGGLTRRGECGQWFGRLTSRKRAAKLRNRLRPEVVRQFNSQQTVLLQRPETSTHERRAA